MDGWWRGKVYSKEHKRTLESSGCALFALSHALQRIGFDIGIVVHRPDPGITHLDCLLHTKCETARTAEIGTGVKVMQTRIGKTLTDHLFRSVAARIVNNEDVTGGVFLFP